MNFNGTPRRGQPASGQHASTASGLTSASKFRSSLVPMIRSSPGRALHSSSRVSDFPSSSRRDLFRTSTPAARPVAQFSPDLPADTMRASSNIRKFAPPKGVTKGVTGGMSGTASSELFKMRIPSPDPELTGEVLAKQVPNYPIRKGTIYADQYMARRVPAHFDDEQRRQFFAILDLRRLKYTADEIFAKKDWKLNILNFAKEYEKSRGLILLRYGLYEFRNVKPSAEVMKQWRAAHGLPDPEPHAADAKADANADGVNQQASRDAGRDTSSNKRKAEEQLTPKDDVPMASTVNQNKRRNLAQEPTDNALVSGPTPQTSKRKADDADESEEGQPAKMQKSTPSAAKSKFESIINNVQKGSLGPPSGSTAQASPFAAQKSNDSGNKATLFGATITGSPSTAPIPKSSMFSSSKPLNGGSSTDSILSGHKMGTPPPSDTRNMFSYLSENPTNISANEQDQDSVDEDSGHGPGPQNSGQDSASSHDMSATAIGTPIAQGGLAPINKAGNIHGSLGSGLGQPGPASKGGLFGRVSMGPDGQPLKAPIEAGSTRTEEPAQTPAKQPGDYTFNAATTPISFGQSSGTVFTPKATEADSGAGQDASQNEDMAQSAPAAKSAVMFGNTSKPSASDESKPTPEAAPPSFFRNSNKATELSKTADADSGASSRFSSQPASQLSPNIFGGKSGPTATPEVRPNETMFPAPKSPPKSLFGAQPAARGALNKPIFGEVGKEESDDGGSAKLSASNIFGSRSAPVSTTGGDQSTAKSSGEASSVFATTKDRPSTISAFGDKKAASEAGKHGGTTVQELETKPVSSGSAAWSNPLFGSAAPQASTPSGSSSLGNSNKPNTAPRFQFRSTGSVPSENKENEPAKSSVFASNPPSTLSTSIFNFQGKTQAASSPSSTMVQFGGSQNTTPSTSFDGAPTQTNGIASKGIDFNFTGNSQTSASTTPFQFGQASSPAGSFTFTAGGPSQGDSFASANGQQSSAPLFGATTSTPNATASSSFSFGGQPQPSTPQATSRDPNKPIFGANTNGISTAPAFSFTSATPPQNASNAFAPKSGVFSNLLQAGGGTSTGSSSPFPAPSSINTTPVNGTPEPQVQPGDGEEAPQEQISLTEGGPGEEDEAVIHEVRAKAIKYVPVTKDNEDGSPDSAKKSPWTTKGVGALRVLRNKSSGQVRVLLRAEPRGHVAMNKAVLPSAEYKAKEKTVTYVAAGDNGGLETWVLQVKRAEAAQELVRVLEANKGANKS